MATFKKVNLDPMEQSISGEPVVTKEQKRLRAAIMEWIKRMIRGKEK